jgi:multidrug transporter EmrE-like cation transporter
MLRRASVLLGLAVLLSLIFPVQALLKETGVERFALRLPVADVAAIGVLLAMLPAFAMFRDARLAHRIPPWSAWVALLALCSVLFVLLHVSWSLDLATAYAREAVAGGVLPRAVSHLWIVEAVELAAKLGVLVSVVAVLMRLEATPDEAAPVPRKKK